MEINKVYVGNNIDILKTFPDNSIDSIVTDPPYGLGKEPNATDLLKDWLDTGYHEVKGKGFMGKEWDAFVPQPIFWKECYRVLKHGGHVLSFAGTRTYDWMVLGLRLAGFEIRDQLAWIYGQGFPKSHDIYKTLKNNMVLRDRLRNVKKNPYNNVEVIKNEKISREQKTEHDLRFMQSTDIQTEKHIRNKQGKVLQQSVSQQDIRTFEQGQESSKGSSNGKESSVERWSDIQTTERELYGSEICENTTRIFSDGEKRRLHNGTQVSDGTTSQQTLDENRSSSPHRPQSKQQSHRQLDFIQDERRTQKNRSDYEETIQQWQGWGTALKPALEPIVMARKPLDGTVADNVLKHGVGGINIDGCRIATNEQSQGRDLPNAKDGVTWGGDLNSSSSSHELGRFPANVIHDGSDEVVALFPSDGEDSAARFFYTSKASQFERNYGLDEFDSDVTTDGRTKSIDNAFNRGETQRKNIHPTVKPIDLMRYLVRLVTPKGGVCLDPFLGSGTTAVAAKAEKFDYIGIELQPEYAEIAKARIKAEIVQYDIFDVMEDDQ